MLNTEDVDLKGELEALKAKLADMDTKPQPVVYMRSDRKFPKFGGRPTKDSDPVVDEWILDMREYIRSAPSKDSHVDFVMDHLVGNAKAEVRLRPPEQRMTGEQILDILEQLYHPKETVTQLQQRFYQRDQQIGETLESYSLSLMTLAEQITRRAGKSMPDKDKILIERFIDGVKDQTLRQELRKFSLEKGPMPFLEFRHVMLSWIEDNPPMTEKQVNKVNTNAVEYRELIEMMKRQQQLLEKQQRQIDYLTSLTSGCGGGEQFNPYNQAGRSRPYTRYPRGRGRGRGTYRRNEIQCFNCSGRGHKASDCPSSKPNNSTQGTESQDNKQQEKNEPNDRPPQS